MQAPLPPFLLMPYRASEHIRPPPFLTNTFSSSCATALATPQLFHLALFRSFLIVLLEVVFGLPLALQPEEGALIVNTNQKRKSRQKPCSYTGYTKHNENSHSMN